MPRTHFRWPALITAAALLATGVAAPAADLPRPEEVVTPTAFASLSGLHPGGRVRIAVAADVLEGWHVNAHVPSSDYLIPTVVELEAPPGIVVGEPTYPEGEMVTFEFADEPLRVYEGRFYVVVTLEAAAGADTGPRRLEGTLSYQPCSDRICLAPAEVRFEIEIPVVSLEQAVSPRWPDIFAELGGVVGPGPPGTAATGEERVAGAAPLVFIALFLGGLALNLTPCVYPLIPITLGFFGGQTGRSTLGTFGLSAVYVLGMATTYSTLGVIVALTGGIFGAALQSPWVLVSVALVLLLLSASQFGLYEFRIPGTTRLGARRGIPGAYLMGLVVGLVAAPCLGPFVVGLLITVAHEGNAVLGFWKFFVLSLGLGTPYLFLGAFSAGLSVLPRAGEWMEGVKHLFGHALVATAAWFLGQAVLQPVGPYLLPLSLTVSAAWLLLFERSSRAAWFTLLRSSAAVIAVTIAIWSVWPEPADRIRFDDYSPGAIRTAAAAGKPVLIDFTADWCVPCREYEHKVFNDARVIEASMGFVNLRADLTRSSSPEVRALVEQYDIFGPPTIVFIDENGKERRDLRLVGYVGPERFLERMHKVGTGEPPATPAVSVSF